MKDVLFRVTENAPLAKGVFRMILSGDVSDITRPGQFLNFKIDGLYLRRPISVCDLSESTVSVVYKTVGEGTEKMSRMKKGECIYALSGLGNGFDERQAGNTPCLIGGGVGVPPLYLLAKRLVSSGARVTAVLGFNTESEIILESDFRALGCSVVLCTADGSRGVKGFVTDALPGDTSFYYACGPEPMLKAVWKKEAARGQLSFERRMGCGFGACMGCSCRTITGSVRICKEGPVLSKEDILWED